MYLSICLYKVPKLFSPRILSKAVETCVSLDNQTINPRILRCRSELFLVFFAILMLENIISKTEGGI